MKNNKVIYSSKIEKNLSITYDSDLHYMPLMNLDYLKSRIENFENDPTTYYFLLGDLINDSGIDVKELKELRDILYKLTKTKTKVYAILGNHDTVTKEKNGIWEEYYNQEYIEMLRNIDGFNLLENEVKKDGDILIGGTSFGARYYDKKNLEPVNEWCNVINNKLNYEDRHTFNILLDHSPYRAFDKENYSNIPYMNNVDIIFSGHFHNGLIPSYVDKYLPFNFGLIGYGNLFPRNARGIKKITDSTIGFISAPITTFAPHYGFLQKLNLLYPPVEQKVLVKKYK